jgi:DNA-binding beta-propeller fold protein YncE
MFSFGCALIVYGTAVVVPLPKTAAAEAVGDPIYFGVSGTEVGTIDIGNNGRLIAVAVVEKVPDFEQDAYISSIAVVEHQVHADGPLQERSTVDLGPGEITDVAVDPQGHFLIANIRADDLNEINQLVVLRDHKEVNRIDLPDSADGIKLSPDGEYLVVAIEKNEMVQVYSVASEGKEVKLAAEMGRDTFGPFFVGEEDRLAKEDLEPESVSFTPDGEMALVTLQEQASVAVVDMRAIRHGHPATPSELGKKALANVVHLPFGFANSRGDRVGSAPDGLSVSPDGSFALVANEGDNRSKHLMGLSVIDLRGGPKDFPEPFTHCIFDLDISLLDGTGLASCPKAGPNGTYPDDGDLLPRIDPNNTAIIELGGRLVAAVNIERATEVQDRGSVLFLDVSDVLDGKAPIKIDRKLIGLGKGARPEGLRAIEDRYVFVAIEKDGGTIARFDLGE